MQMQNAGVLRYAQNDRFYLFIYFVEGQMGLRVEMVPLVGMG